MLGKLVRTGVAAALVGASALVVLAAPAQAAPTVRPGTSDVYTYYSNPAKTGPVIGVLLVGECGAGLTGETSPYFTSSVITCGPDE